MSQDAGQGGLELVLGLLHLLLVGSLLSHQPADVAVGQLDHGVEVVGVPPVHLASLHPGEQHAHRLRKLAVVWEEEVELGAVSDLISLVCENAKLLSGEHLKRGIVRRALGLGIFSQHQ